MRDTEISCERGIVMVEERTENQELMAALDTFRASSRASRRRAKAGFPDYCCGYPDSCDRSRSGYILWTALGGYNVQFVSEFLFCVYYEKT